MPLFTLRAEGTYALGDQSPHAADACYSDFHFARRYLTAHNPAFAELFNVASTSTPWEIDVERDVSADGCAFVPSVSASPTEYDLMKLDGPRLYFGDRSQDLSKSGQSTAAVGERPAGTNNQVVLGNTSLEGRRLSLCRAASDIVIYGSTEPRSASNGDRQMADQAGAEPRL